MQDKPTFKSGPTDFSGMHPLKLISAEQFAALGVESVVFVREIDGEDLLAMMPQANLQAEAGPFLLVMSADGRPVLVTDSEDSLEAWLEDQPVVLAPVH